MTPAVHSAGGRQTPLARQPRPLFLHTHEQRFGARQLLWCLCAEKTLRIQRQNQLAAVGRPPAPLSHASDSALVISPISGPANSSTIAASAEPLWPPKVNIAPFSTSAASVVGCP